MLLKEGIAPTTVITGLTELITRLQNLASTWGTGTDAWRYGQNSYLQTTETMEQLLLSWFEDDDGVGAGVQGGGYRLVREMTAATPRPYPLVSGEIDRQVRALTALKTKLEVLQALQARDGDPAVLDTNVLMHFQRLDEIPWAEVLGKGPVRIILPICVIDELDNKKYIGSDRMSRRADQAIRVLRQYSSQLGPGSCVTLPDGTMLEIFLDEPDHRRKLNPDEELFSRCTLLERMIGKPLKIVTGDLGMQLRADAHGLGSVELPDKYAKDALRRSQVSDET
jgi:PIN domain